MKTAKISLAFILPVLFVLAVAYAPLPLAAAPAHAATNTILLGSYESTSSYPYYKYVQAATSVSAYAGGEVTAVDGASAPGYFDINLSNIVISSGSVTLYLSNNSVASLTSGVNTQYIANLPAAYIIQTVHTSPKGPLENFYNVTYNGMNISLGNYSVIGPAPMFAGGTYYIKAFFGSTAPVAASYASLTILPNIVVSPISGGAGTPITVNGTGFSANSVANVTYWYY
ncbi:MAG: hypothetical protein ACP5UD_10395, partial [Conexivisphaera sp.]